jgi:hypothetical protein
MAASASRWPPIALIFPINPYMGAPRRLGARRGDRKVRGAMMALPTWVRKCRR